MINKQYESKGSGFIEYGQELPINGEFYEVRYLSDLTEKATEHFEIAMCVGSLFMTIEPDHLTGLCSKTRLLDKFITHFRHIPKHGTLVPYSETVQSGFSEIVENIIRDVAELPDRTSPENWPKLAADVILPDSPEAASEITVTAWQSRKGLIYLDQNIARWDGSTHRICKRGHLNPKQGYCEICVPLDNQEEYATYPTQKWNGEILYSMANDEWLYDTASVFALLNESGKSVQELMLVLAEPTFAQGIDPDDYYEGDLPNGITVPYEIESAFDALNEAIKNCNKPLCYYPSKIAAIIDMDAMK